MIKVGITGGIGSGKTTVCRIFETLGIPVYYADEEAKRLMTEDPVLVKEIKSIFGPKSYQDDGQLNRALIAQLAFSDPVKLSQLNQVVHPAVARDGVRWNAVQEGKPYTLKEAALLFESGADQHLDKIICVTAPLETRISRVMNRDKSTREAVVARIEHQMPEREKVERADFIIYNDGKQLLIPQVLKIHQSLLELEKEQSER